MLILQLLMNAAELPGTNAQPFLMVLLLAPEQLDHFLVRDLIFMVLSFRVIHYNFLSNIF